jgi:hypothetical protein
MYMQKVRKKKGAIYVRRQVNYILLIAEKRINTNLEHGTGTGGWGL